MNISYENDNSLKCYRSWDSPDLIISDGAYGVGGFPGDPLSPDDLGDWYLPHIQAWSRYSKPSTSLWFWNTEIGWATVHPLLKANGWDYVETVVWDKGLSHVAGNVNSKTIRQFPVVTEIAVLYRKRLHLPTAGGVTLSVKQWLRSEWCRSGLPLYKANEACGTKNAATRKYLTQDHLWYWPSGEAVERMARFATAYGKKTEHPYFSLDSRTPITAKEWDDLRAIWNHEHGCTNVWSKGQLAGSERIKRKDKKGTVIPVHLNQKPLEFMVRQVEATTNPGGVVWEPFGGLGTASIAAVQLGRKAFYAETSPLFYKIAVDRFDELNSSLCKEAV